MINKATSNLPQDSPDFAFSRRGGACPLPIKGGDKPRLYIKSFFQIPAYLEPDLSGWIRSLFASFYGIFRKLRYGLGDEKTSSNVKK
ncbi:MAG: hypothetical protein NT009_07245 [Proteobacteria bacterium]|nr:hypothetical protein [Pseudomonadota bacterium]